MRVRFQILVVLLTLDLGIALAAGHQALPQEPPSSGTADETAQPSFPISEDLVIDLRLFESRAISPNYDAMRELNFFIMTDGRDVTATQWPSTLAKQVPDTFLATLMTDTAPVEQGIARFAWNKGSRSIQTEIRIDQYHPAGTFPVQLKTRFLRGDDAIAEHEGELQLQMHRTTVWSGDALEIAATDYLSHFREYPDRESRGLLYELIRPNTFFLIFAATPRLLTEEERSMGDPQTIELPSGISPPHLENPTGIHLKGTVVLGFVLDETGRPVNPQILRSTFPEANMRMVEEALQWQFPPPNGGPQNVQVELVLDVPRESP